jgi:hypothetical protein
MVASTAPRNVSQAFQTAALMSCGVAIFILVLRALV